MVLLRIDNGTSGRPAYQIVRTYFLIDLVSPLVFNYTISR